VEFTQVIDKRSKEAKATRIRLLRRAPQQPSRPASTVRPELNKGALKKLGGEASSLATQRFHMAKGPASSGNGFPAGRGRGLPPRKTKLNVAAKAFQPSF